MRSYRQRLLYRFRQQEAFAAGYSPLYAQLFAALSGWLDEEAEDPVVSWLLTTTQDRAPFDVTLLLPAALHRAVLAGEPAAAELASFYPTTGGTVPDPASGLLGPVLHKAILDQRDTLAPFLRQATVQTNETVRGLAWLWPMSLAGWPEFHLLELGASAGLNLLAEQRAYRLVGASDNSELLNIGSGQPTQFEVRYTGALQMADRPPAIPRIASRTGVDVAPFYLRTRGDELSLASFVWGDQPERLRRLREGIAALRTLEARGDGPTLHQVRLPEQLESFLMHWLPQPAHIPVVVYNTTVTMYLAGRESGLRATLDKWAARRSAPVVWLQWEPPREGEEEAPEIGWLAWTADVWHAGDHSRHRLAWVHPHANGLRWEPGLKEFESQVRSLH